MKRLFSIFSVMVFVMISGACIDENVDEFEELVKVGDRLPTFVVTTNEDTTVTSEQLSSGISLVIFFHTGCPDCQAVLPIVQQLYEEYCADGVQFLLISREEAQVSVAQYWMLNHLTMPYSAQSDRRIYELFAHEGVPRIYISKDGVIRSVFTDAPMPTYEELKEALILLMGYK